LAEFGLAIRAGDVEEKLIAPLFELDQQLGSQIFEMGRKEGRHVVAMGKDERWLLLVCR
jgi:hypothetical protein